MTIKPELSSFLCLHIHIYAGNEFLLFPLYDQWIKIFELSGNSFDSFHRIRSSIRMDFDFISKMASYADCTLNLFVLSTR